MHSPSEGTRRSCKSRELSNTCPSRRDLAAVQARIGFTPPGVCMKQMARMPQDLASTSAKHQPASGQMSWACTQNRQSPHTGDWRSSRKEDQDTRPGGIFYEELVDYIFF